MSSVSENNVGLMMLVRRFHAAHGYRGFLTQGVGPEMLRATYMRVSKFFLFPVAHRRIWGIQPSEGTPLSKGLAAAICSLPEGLTIAPIETAKIGLQLDIKNVYKNSATAFLRHILATQGWTGLFVGYFGIGCRQASWTIAYFATLEDFKRLSKAVIPDHWDTAQRTAGGMAAGMFGAVFNTPCDVIRSSIQRRILSSGSWSRPAFGPGMVLTSGMNFASESARITATDGLRGLWTGFTFKALHLGGSGALLAVLIPFFKEAMGVHQE